MPKYLVPISELLYLCSINNKQAMKQQLIKCTNCGRPIDPKKIKWLELSITDGCYYTVLPSSHLSQGSFSFGTDCAISELKRTLKSIRQA